MTLTHSSFHLEMDEISFEIQHLSKNSYIEKFVSSKPDIPALRLQLLNLFLQDAAVPKQLRKAYCVTAGLVQMGLDIHETITVQKESQDKAIRNRQLSILAGDYYSSKYYALLSKYNLIDGVKKIASGIKMINIAKMRLYTNVQSGEMESTDQLLNAVKEKESSLYIQFLDQASSENKRKHWNQIITEMITLFTLLEELQQNQNYIHRYQLSFHLVNHYANYNEKLEVQRLLYSELKTKMKNLYHKYGIQSKLEDIMQQIYYSLKDKVAMLENPMIMGELELMLNQYESTLQLQMNVAKEF